MALKPKALGRGLGNLIPVNESKIPIDSSSESALREIRISEIRPNPGQPRKTFSEESLKELSETIKAHGVIQPIVVKELDSGYEIISGERRYRACKLAGFIKIPAIVKNVSENQSMEMAIIENIQREDLNPIEEAIAYKTLSEKLNLKITDISARVGKNRSTISNLIRLLQLPDSVQDLIKNGRISEGHARPLLSLADRKKIEQLAYQIAEKGLTARQVEDLVSNISEGRSSSPEKKKSRKDVNIVELENKFRKKYSMKIEIGHNQNSGKGKMTIAYPSLEAMEKILNALGL
ncbi:ParB/RepB/Spo0J family partition protein [Leptospira noguchii]|uniref:ParB-like protein n=3 Tax=Leptospira noguchii TaxID=28182 RepID=M6U680_9LEPT|nr:ParB/RepB/Spo0J family partition protein [Leptospira noguchii]EKR73181.1 ParB-like protein [Leptospira noguchii str. 2006001870]EMN01315.1 ParB-like protein [Leptospira noguchii str. 2007001578]EMO40507.1 ParB-like protein [Leptospira noguchii serovar Autumnalis str. ZUN142]EPE86594.1 ParB-like protein [Leptospira noguchii str. 1993005606]TQE72407.1 ParB/RepB/Spo0J family partition protein [Leptospira noguchii]